MYRKEFSILNKEIKVKTDGPYKNGKYAGWIDLYTNGKLTDAIFSTGPIYDKEEDALKQMNEIADDIRKQ